MKRFTPIFLLTLSALSTPLLAEVEPAATYPELPKLADLIAAKTTEAAAFPDIKDPGDPLQIASSTPLPIVPDLLMGGDASALTQTVQRPAIAVPGAPGDPVSLSATVRIPAITALTEATPPDLFTINRLFNWGKPHGQWMNQMLKDIETARKAGDMETYTTLTARYTAWAEKYLRPDSPPKLDGKLGH
jgi:hypothetical protein